MTYTGNRGGPSTVAYMAPPNPYDNLEMRSAPIDKPPYNSNLQVPAYKGGGELVRPKSSINGRHMRGNYNNMKASSHPDFYPIYGPQGEKRARSTHRRPSRGRDQRNGKQEVTPREKTADRYRAPGREQQKRGLETGDDNKREKQARDEKQPQKETKQIYANGPATREKYKTEEAPREMEPKLLKDSVNEKQKERFQGHREPEKPLREDNRIEPVIAELYQSKLRKKVEEPNEDKHKTVEERPAPKLEKEEQRRKEVQETEDKLRYREKETPVRKNERVEPVIAELYQSKLRKKVDEDTKVEVKLEQERVVEKPEEKEKKQEIYPVQKEEGKPKIVQRVDPISRELYQSNLKEKREEPETIAQKEVIKPAQKEEKQEAKEHEKKEKKEHVKNDSYLGYRDNETPEKAEQKDPIILDLYRSKLKEKHPDPNDNKQKEVKPQPVEEHQVMRKEELKVDINDDLKKEEKPTVMKEKLAKEDPYAYIASYPDQKQEKPKEDKPQQMNPEKKAERPDPYNYRSKEEIVTENHVPVKVEEKKKDLGEEKKEMRTNTKTEEPKQETKTEQSKQETKTEEPKKMEHYNQGPKRNQNRSADDKHRHERKAPVEPAVEEKQKPHQRLRVRGRDSSSVRGKYYEQAGRRIEDYHMRIARVGCGHDNREEDAEVRSGSHEMQRQRETTGEAVPGVSVRRRYYELSDMDEVLRDKIATQLRQNGIGENKVVPLSAKITQAVRDDVIDANSQVSPEVTTNLKEVINKHLDPILFNKVNATDLKESQKPSDARHLSNLVLLRIGQVHEEIDQCKLSVNDPKNRKGKGHTHWEEPQDRSSMMEIKDRIQKQKTENDILREQLKKAEKETHEVADDKDKKQELLQSLDSDNWHLKKGLNEAELEKQNLQSKVSEQRKDVQLLDRQHQDLRQENNKLKGKLSDSQTWNKNVSADLLKLQSENARLKVLADQRQKEILHLRDPDQDMLHQLKILSDEVTLLRTQTRRLNEEKGILKSRSQKLESSMEESLRQKGRLSIEKDNLQRENDELKLRYRKLALTNPQQRPLPDISTGRNGPWSRSVSRSNSRARSRNVQESEDRRLTPAQEANEEDD